MSRILFVCSEDYNMPFIHQRGDMYENNTLGRHLFCSSYMAGLSDKAENPGD